MATNMKEYTLTKHDGLYQHNTDKAKYVFNFPIEGKYYRRTWKGLLTVSDKDRLKMANTAMEKMKATIAAESKLSVSATATINDYYDRLANRKYPNRTADEITMMRTKLMKGKNHDQIEKINEMKDKEIIEIINKDTDWSGERRYRNDLFFDKYIREGLGLMAVKDVKPKNLSYLNDTLIHLATRSQKVAYELLVPVFNMAIEDELISISPIKKDHRPVRKASKEKKVVLNAVDKYHAIYEAINKVFADNHHHRALFLFGFHGRRLNEVVTLQWGDIDFDAMTFTVRGENSKVDTDMQFSLPMDVSEALKKFRETKGDVFNIKRVETLYSKIREASGVEEFSFHWMRNLSVSALSALGVGLTDLSAMLGHTDLNTLKKYLTLQYKDSTKNINNVVAKLLSEPVTEAEII